jgi:phage tail P2-like protein
MPDRKAQSLLPGSIADARGRAFAAVMERALSEPEFRKLLFERIDQVDAAVLPYLVREFAVQDFVEPGMSEAVVRRLIKEAPSLNATRGYIHGVRRGLAMLGMKVSWKQWFQQTPPGQPGTHRVTVYVNETIFDGQTAMLDARMQRAALRMIDGMKRWSQFISFEIGVALTGRVRVAAAGEALQIGAFGATATTPRRARGLLDTSAAAQALQIGQFAATATTPRRGRTTLAAACAGQALQIGQFSAVATHRSLR